MSGGKSFSRGALYHILNRRLYIGEIAYRGNVYPGQHEAIIDRETWEKAAALLAQNNQGDRRRGNSQDSSLLTGILFDAAGNRYTPTHAVKKGKRYHYYTSQAVIHGRKTSELGRIPAHELDLIVETRIKTLLCSPADLSSLFGEAGMPATKLRDGIAAAQKMANELTPTAFRQSIRAFLKRVVIHESRASIDLSADVFVKVIFGSESRESSQNEDQTTPKGPMVTIDCGFELRHGSNELRLVIPGTPSRESDQATSLIKAIARAHFWYERIISGEVNSLEQLAHQADMTPRYVSRILRYGRMSPHMVKAILDSRHEVRISSNWSARDLSVNWSKQPETSRQDRSCYVLGPGTNRPSPK
jgi:AraC-like DNA-binding protein